MKMIVIMCPVCNVELANIKKMQFTERDIENYNRMSRCMTCNERGVAQDEVEIES